MTGATPRVERGVTAAAVRALARLAPWDPGHDEELAAALRFLGWNVESERLLQAGDGAAMVACLAVLAPGIALVGPAPPLLVVALAVGLAASLGTRYLPRLFATARRTRALGQAPGLVSRAVLRMRLSPTPETAAAFAAETGSGRLARSLDAHVARAAGSGRAGLSAFADEWAAWFPALRRALTLVESAGEASGSERERALDSALDVTLEGTRETMADFAAAVQGPATALYAFGVLLPLSLVALLPTAGTVGVEVSLLAVVAGYDVVLPLALVAASAWLLARRPVAFPPPEVPRSHPDVPDRRWPALAAGALTVAVGWGAATRVVAPWAAAVAAPAAGVGVGLVVAYRPAESVRERVERIESDLADGLYLVGREVGRGRSVEAALDDAVELLDSPTDEVFGDATRQQRQLTAGVRESFLGDDGALATVPSERARSTAELLAVAASEGKPAGPAIVEMADHLDDLQGVETTVRRDLRQVTSTLAHTATVFGPLVGGATVALAGRMSAGGPLTSAVPTAALGLAVGGYVVALAVILTVLATGLERGLERSLVGYRVGRALVSAAVVFVFALAATRLFV